MVAAVKTIADVSPETMIPDLFAAHPHARVVFDRYGLSGCGGALGPVESVGFFARTHGVDEQQLLREVRQQIALPVPQGPVALVPTLADTIYRRYFLGGIILILTAGATWGAWMLIKIGLNGKFTGDFIHDVNAHGHAQIYGWVGLFVMGFAYQAFPRMWHSKLVAPRLAVVAFVLMAAGLVVRTVGMTMHGVTSHAVCAAMVGGAMEIASIVLFTGQILATFRRSGARLEPYVGFAVMALVFFVGMSLMDVWHTWTTMTAATKERLVWYVATYQAPLRDLQIHGLALFMILGVSIRMLPALFDWPEVPRRRAWQALVVLALAVVGECVVFIAYRWTGNHAVAALLMVPWLMLTIGCAMIAVPMRLWSWRSNGPAPDRSAKFVRAAYLWLAVSLVMLLLMPVYQAATGIAFSHAYYGAIRHAITVGFVSLMIMGMAAKVVPTLNGLDPRSLTRLWGPFVLVNLGCFLRVSLQTLTDAHPGFFHVVGVSGLLEVTGLAWWGLGLAAIMRRGKKDLAERSAPPKPERIEPGAIVADVLAWFPQTADVFDRFGFAPLRNPVARATLARTVTLAQAARLKGVDLDALLSALNATIPPPADPRRRSLPVLVGAGAS